jgi:hypothetical protein
MAAGTLPRRFANRVSDRIAVILSPLPQSSANKDSEMTDNRRAILIGMTRMLADELLHDATVASAEFLEHEK